MTTILYRIPDKYFPAVKVTKPFLARVKYEYANDEVIIHEASFSPQCLMHIDNTKGMVEKMKEDIEQAEKRRENELHPVFEEIFKAHGITK